MPAEVRKQEVAMTEAEKTEPAGEHLGEWWGWEGQEWMLAEK